MVKALLVVVSVVRSAWLLELAGAAAGVFALWLAWGDAAAWAGVSVGLLLKAYERDLRAS